MEFANVEGAYDALGRYVQAFVGNRAWEEGGCKCRIYAKMASGSHWLKHFGTVSEEGGFEDDPDAIWGGLDAATFLRDHFLRTTGQRIWGLTFTLYPGGKFDIEYDYDKPEGYEETREETLSLYQAVGRLEALGIEVETAEPLPSGKPETDLLRRARLWLEAQTEENRAWGLGEETRWNLEMGSGELRFEFADGRARSVPVQIVGTYDTRDGSFMWGWDHPSVPEALRSAARRVHDYGTEHGIERFTSRTVACTEDDAWDFTAAAAMLDGAAGAYRGDAGGTWVYMSFGEAV